MKKVMVFGVFDLLHPGHISFLKQAKALATRRRQGFGGQGFLVVSVARDKNVKKVKKHLPQQSEKIRAKNLRKVQFVNKVVLGGLKDPWPHIIKERPDVIALGYDQGNYVMNHESRNMKHGLGKELQRQGLKIKVVRLKAFKPEIYKSSRIRKRS